MTLLQTQKHFTVLTSLNCNSNYSFKLKQDKVIRVFSLSDGNFEVIDRKSVVYSSLTEEKYINDYFLVRTLRYKPISALRMKRPSEGRCRSAFIVDNSVISYPFISKTS